MLPAGDMSPAGSIVGALRVYHKLSCKHKSSAPEDGRNYRPKHVGLIEVINKLSLLHLVGCLCYCSLVCVTLLSLWGLTFQHHSESLQGASVGYKFVSSMGYASRVLACLLACIQFGQMRSVLRHTIRQSFVQSSK